MNPIPNTADELLLKKFLGVPDANPGLVYTQEAAGNARPFVFSSQILSQSIPSSTTLITDFTITSYIWGQLNNSGPLYYYDNIILTSANTAPNQVRTVAIGTISTSQLYPMIQKITCTLSAVNPGISYRFSNPASTTINYLSQAIPFNFDLAGGSYNYNIIDSITQKAIVNQYYVDTDAGYLYFPNGDWTNLTANGTTPIFPIITFYRYNGIGGGSVVINTNSNTPITLSTTTTNTINLPITLSGAYNCLPITNPITINFTGGINNGSYIFYIPGCTSSGKISFVSGIFSSTVASISSPYSIDPTPNTTCTVIMIVTVFNGIYYVNLPLYNSN